jgi:hypothetical protein
MLSSKFHADFGSSTNSSIPQQPRALNSAVECHLHTVEVAGSNPAAPTIISATYGESREAIGSMQGERSIDLMELMHLAELTRYSSWKKNRYCPLRILIIKEERNYRFSGSL